MRKNKEKKSDNPNIHFTKLQNDSRTAEKLLPTTESPILKNNSNSFMFPSSLMENNSAFKLRKEGSSKEGKIQF